MKKSDLNKAVIENFILHYTHQNRDEATGEAQLLYDALDTYIEEDHVDGIQGDDQGVDQARSVLRSAGYFVDNLWHVADVKNNYLNVNGDEVTDEEAQVILHDTLKNSGVVEYIWDAMRIIAEDGSHYRKKAYEN